MKRFIGWTAFVVALAVMVAPAYAAKGGNKGKPGAQVVAVASISVNQTDLHVGGAATFTATYPEMRNAAMIWVRCWQGGDWIYQKSGSEVAEFLLSSASWPGGGADCTAELYYDVYQGQTLVAREWLAQTSFVVTA